MGELPNLPTNVTRLREDMEPQFARVPSVGPDWYIVGPAAKLEPGKRVLVPRYSKHDEVAVDVGAVVAEHVVHHLPDSRYGTGDVRYVLVEFERAPTAEQPPRKPPARRPLREWWG